MAEPKLSWKHAAAYLAAGVATLAWSTDRAGKGLDVWPGFGTHPPGALVGAAETVAFWPVAAFHNFRSMQHDQKPSAAPASPPTPGDQAPLRAQLPASAMGVTFGENGALLRG